MTRIYTLLLGVALTLNGCATAGPIAIKCGIQDVQIAAADYAEIKADIQTKNWTDLAKVGESIGWATLDCALGDEATKNPAAKPGIDEFRRLRAVEFRSAKSACRSPGDATPKTGPTASLDSTKTRGARPALPGADGTTEATASVGAREPAGTPDGPAATFLRAGPTAGRHAHNLDNRVQLTGPQPSTAPPPAAPGVSIGRRAGGSATQGKPGVATRSGESFSYPGPNVGSQAEQCDRTCHEHLTGLATVDGCECHRKINGVWRWVAAR